MKASPPLPWARIEASLRRMLRGPRPHRMSPWRPGSPRRAAVAVLLRGDDAGARELVLVQRGPGAPRHAGELAFPGGMVELFDRDLPATARRELAEELGVTGPLWEMGCLPDGVAKACIRFTPVLFRWEEPAPRYVLSHEIQAVLPLPLLPLLEAPWTTETLEFHGLRQEVPRLELPEAPLWGATAFVLKGWLDVLSECRA